MKPRATLSTWLAEPLPAEVKRPLEKLLFARDVQRVAVMPDVHFAGSVAIGVVVATTRLVYPEAVGGDIGCGICAAPLGVPASAVTEESAGRLLDALYRGIPLRRHHRVDVARKRHDSANLDAQALSHSHLQKLAQHEGIAQFGTLGSGNHFVEFQADENEDLWIMIHSGSRAMGQAIRDHHLERAQTTPSKLTALDTETDTGREYLTDMMWALDYANASRLAMLAAVDQIVGEVLHGAVNFDEYLGCHHNHVLRETHGGKALWVHRKGAIQAGDGVGGIIPGSMGSESFHVRGRGSEEALCSSSHGAGRAMSRTEASRRISQKAFQAQMEGVLFDQRKWKALRDEAPAAYKDIGKVMRAQKKLTRIERRLRPILVYKGA